MKARKRTRRVKLTLDQCRALLLAHFNGQALNNDSIKVLKRMGWVERFSEEITPKGMRQLHVMGL